MTALEKILQEIEEKAVCKGNQENGFVLMKHIREIIQKHLSENHCSECSRRKFYQIGYRDGKKDNDWVLCSERMPDGYESDYSGKYMKMLEIAYMTDTVEYTHGYYDGFEWFDQKLHKIINVIAWKSHTPYIPPVESADGKRMREREEFFTEYKEQSDQTELNGFLKKRFMEVV